MSRIDMVENRLTWYRSAICPSIEPISDMDAAHNWEFHVDIDRYPYDIEILKHLMDHDLGAFTKLICLQERFDFETRFTFYDDFNTQYDTTLLLFAIRVGSYKQLVWLLERGASIDSCEYCTNGLIADILIRTAMDIAREVRLKIKIINLLEDWSNGSAAIKSAK